MRTFIALEVPQEFADDMAALARQLKMAVEGRFLPRNTYHLTLAFLGETGASDVAAAIDAMEAACMGAGAGMGADMDMDAGAVADMDMDAGAGAVADMDVDLVASTGKGAGPIPLRSDGLGKFGRASDATLWLGIAPSPALAQLVARLREELAARDIAFDGKPFKPHITLARRAHVPKTTLPALAFPQDSTATAITLFKSTLERTQATYKPLHTIQLRRKCDKP